MTDEDIAIWTWLCLRNTGVMGAVVAGLQRFYQACDRHDAQLMWWAQRHPQECEVIPASDEPTDPYRIHIRAWIAPPDVESAREWPDIEGCSQSR